jgi:hypothetical protein
MTVFAIVAKEPKPELESVLETSYTNGHYRFADRVWFVVGTDTARDVSDKLKLTNGGITGVVVMPITDANYGVASAELWNWLRSAHTGKQSR